MYNVLKSGSEIFIREQINIRNDLIGDVVIFRTETRNPNDWVPKIVNVSKVRENFPVLRRFLETLDQSQKKKWKKFEADLLELAMLNHAMLKKKATIALNENLLQKDGNPSSGEYFVPKKSQYQNHCWKCGSDVDSEFQLSHSECKWLICSQCGACGCGFDRS